MSFPTTSLRKTSWRSVTISLFLMISRRKSFSKWQKSRLLSRILFQVSLLPSMVMMKSKKASSLSCLEGPKRISASMKEAGFGLILTFASWEILQLLNPSYCSRFIKYLVEVSIQVEGGRALWGWLQMWGKIHRPESLCLRVEHWYWVIRASAASISSIRWTKTQGLSYSRRWNSKQSPSPKQGSSAN